MDEIVCKCGARTYGQHIISDKPAHTFKQDKSSSQVRGSQSTDQVKK
jgi:hypothetical protein